MARTRSCVASSHCGEPVKADIGHGRARLLLKGRNFAFVSVILLGKGVERGAKGAKCKAEP